MKSIQTKIIFVITLIMLVMTLAFGITATFRINKILDEDSDRVLMLTADQNAHNIDAILSSVEQSVETIYNYAEKRTETYSDFLTDADQRQRFTYDVSELGKSIAEKTSGAMSVYLRYNPEDFGPTDGFWYTINIHDGSWNQTTPTDMSLYSKDDEEHVGWYYIPVETGKPLWMDPYYNKNLGVEMISYIIPYFHDGYTVGIIGMDIDLQLLRDSVESITIYESGRAFMVSPKGDIIFHFDYPKGVSRKNLTDKITPFINSVLGSEINRVNTLKGIDKIKRKIVLKKLRNGMILGLNTPVDEINVPRDTLTRQLLLVSAIIMIPAILICLTWVRTIIAPLKKMTQVAEHYADGDYSDEMNIGSSDEIGILSRSLQTMSTSLKNQIEIADAANKSKSIFLANMSHEIRTPINAILGFDEMILRECRDPGITGYAANIKSSGQTLLTLVNEILDFSKIESGKMEIIPVQYSPVSLLNNMLDMVELRAEKKGLTVQCDIDSNIPSMLFGDDIRIREVITNLLTNAVKYTDEGSVTLSVKCLSAVNNTARLHVSVKDTGIGIKDEDRDRLWDSFQRIDESHNRNIEGTGLGLSITLKYLELMNSSLELDSEYGKGSEFWFELDQGIEDPTPIGDFETVRTGERNGIEIYNEAFEAPDARILVVDDIEMNLTVFKGLLKYSLINIDTAGSGFEALDMMKNNEYDLVFLDHMMPRMDGIETLSHIIRDRDIINPDIPVIALTANAISGARKMYTDHGFSDYLTKPIEAKQLEKMLLKYLPKDKVKLKNDTLNSNAKPEGDFEVLTFDAVSPNGDTQAINDASLSGTRKGETVIDTKKGLTYSGGRKDLYKMILSAYLDEPYEEKLVKAYESRNAKDYQINAHALKSSSQGIGAGKMFEMARESELSLKGRADDVDFETTTAFTSHEALLKQLRITRDEVRSLIKEL